MPKQFIPHQSPPFKLTQVATAVKLFCLYYSQFNEYYKHQWKSTEQSSTTVSVE